LDDELIRRIRAMGEKKQKQATKNWYKVLAIIGCILFVVLMVVSSMGSSWVNFFSVIKPGDTVTIDYTIRDARGSPIVTTDQQLYTTVAGSGYGLFFGKQLVIQANQSTTKGVIPLPVYYREEGWSKSFALFGAEHDAITMGVIGMKQNEQKTITMPFKDSMTQAWSADQLTRNGVNLSEVQVGDSISMGVSDSPELATNTTPQTVYIRIGEVTKKTSEGVVINFGYPAIDVRIVAISKQ
jgi:flagellar basal body-associated protein FliL